MNPNSNSNPNPNPKPNLNLIPNSNPNTNPNPNPSLNLNPNPNPNPYQNQKNNLNYNSDQIYPFILSPIVEGVDPNILNPVMNNGNNFINPNSPQNNNICPFTPFPENKYQISYNTN